jgi:SAM-dependent methyltransferase
MKQNELKEYDDDQTTPPRVASIDFALAWQGALEQDPTARLSAQTDLAFWETYAPTYEQRSSLPQTYANTLHHLSNLISPTDRTLLDMGAGTGRFTLPLASRMQQITALDHSSAMLAILQQKLQTQQVKNVSILEAAWEDAQIEAHDVVLAAWSIYRQLDLRATLQKLIQATKHTLIIVTGDTYAPPHQSLAQSLWGTRHESPMPLYLYILGALRQIEIRADLRIVYEMTRYHASTPGEIARQLASTQATEQEVQHFTASLLPLLDQQADGWHYTFPCSVAVLAWHADKR